MFNNKILEKIYNNYINKKPKFKSNYKLSFLQRAGLFVPVLNLYNILKIRKNISKEIKRAEKELKKDISFNFDKNSIFLDNFGFILNCMQNCMFAAGLLLMFHSLGDGIFLTATATSFIFLIAILVNVCKIDNEEIEKIVLKPKNDISDILSKEDMMSLSKKIDSQILEDFLVKNNFNITYDDLLEIDKEIQKKESRKNETVNREKAKEILLSLSSEVSNKEDVKEEEVKYV